MKFILSFILFLCVLFCNAQTFTKTISRNSNSIQNIKIYPGKYGNYYVAGVDSGTVFVIKFNNIHDTLWTRSSNSIWFNTVNLIETNDNGCAILAFDNGSTMRFVKFDSTGVVNMSKLYEASGHEIGSEILQTYDSCFILCAPVTHIGNPSYYYNQLIKVDQNGDTLWSKEIQSDSYSYDIFEYGTDLYFSGHGNGLFKTNQDVFLTWGVGTPTPFTRMGIPEKFIGARNDTLFMTGIFGQTSNSDSSALFLYDTSGTFLNAKFFPDYEIRDAVLTNEYGISLVLKNTINDTSLFVKLDKYLNVISCTGTMSYSSQFLDVIQLQTQNNSFLLTGNALDSASATHEYNLVLADSVGNSACASFLTNCNIVDIHIDSYVFPLGNSFWYAYFSYNDIVFIPGQNTLEINIECISTAIDEVEKRQILLFPNPAHDYVEINSIDEKADIKIYDLLGNLIEGVDDFKLPGKLNVQNYSAGIYLISISGTNANSISKIIIF